MSSSFFTETLQYHPVIPVVTLDKAAWAVPLAKALLAGGIRVMEITLRTDEGLAAIQDVIREVPDMVVGAGSVWSLSRLEQAQSAGSHFVVMPGCTPELLQAACEAGTRLIPGVATASDIMLCLQYGIETVKLFPAENLGGITLLKALGGPFPHIRFVPTGGINRDNMVNYLQLPCVAAVGGSWLTPADVVESGDWELVTALAADAVAQAKGISR